MAAAPVLFARSCALSGVLSILAWQMYGSMLDAAFLFSALVTISALIWGVLHWDNLSVALDATPIRILSWVVFVGSCAGLVVIARIMNVPLGWDIGLAFSITLYLWWSYYSLEPARA